MNLFTQVIVLFLFILPTAQADECSSLTGLPGEDQYEDFQKFINKNDVPNSCSLIDQDPFYQDEDLKKKWCSQGCQAEVKDDQKRVVMPEMATPEAKRWHRNWHTASQIYGDRNIKALRKGIDLKKKNGTLTQDDINKIRGGLGGMMGFETEPSEEDPKAFSAKELSTLTTDELLTLTANGKERLQQFMFYGDIPSLCHTTISVDKRKPIPIVNKTIPNPPTTGPGGDDKEENPPADPTPPKSGTLGGKGEKPTTIVPPGLSGIGMGGMGGFGQQAEDDFSPEYKDCVEKNWDKDLRQFIVSNQQASGENFLYMHHTMRNQVQMMLSDKGLPCIAGWADIPGPDGKTGNKEGAWEEIWELGHEEAGDILMNPQERQEMETLKLSKSEYLKKKSDELAKSLVAKKKSGGNVDAMRNVLRKTGVNVLGKVFENEDFLKSVSMDELGRLMESTVHGQMHGAFGNKAGCSYKDVNGQSVDLSKPPTGCNLSDPSGAHIHTAFWKLHGWCDDVMKKWMTAGDRDYKNIGTTDTCQEKSCFRMQGTWSGGMPAF